MSGASSRRSELIRSENEKLFDRIVEYNSVRLQLLSEYSTEHSPHAGRPRCNRSLKLLALNEDVDTARRRLMESGHLLYGLEKQPLLVISQCAIDMYGQRIEWGIWTVEPTEVELARAQLQEILEAAK